MDFLTWGPRPGFEGLWEHTDDVSHICRRSVDIFLGRRATAAIRFPIGSGAQRHVRIPDLRESPGTTHKEKITGPKSPLAETALFSGPHVAVLNP